MLPTFSSSRPTVHKSKLFMIFVTKFWGKYGLFLSLACAGLVWIWGTLRSHTKLVRTTHIYHQINRHKERKIHLPFQKYNIADTVLHRPDEQPVAAFYDKGWTLPLAFEPLLQRARTMKQSCQSLSSKEMDLSLEMLVRNETFASLPSLGIIETLEAWKKVGTNHPEADEMLIDVEDTSYNWQCQLPPETECDETLLTVVFMAYNPDRLAKLLRQIKTFLNDTKWKTLIAECVLVWNGPRPIEESNEGKELLALAEHLAFRIVYPLRRGLENDLMNRYHPSVVRVEQSKAILFYDDDGPFYSFEAVQSGFELWKRHARAQVGAMSRNFRESPRQKAELQKKDQKGGATPRDEIFVAHCTNMDDFVEYNFRYFANYDAHMVLPSGSLLHVNYLCFLWHPVLEPIRKFVRDHPVHPDDAAVSMVVSQLSGRAPRTYSRRLNPQNEKDILMYQQLSKPSIYQKLGGEGMANSSMEDESVNLQGIVPMAEIQRRRSLMFDINWDAKGKGDKEMEDMKQFWAELRTQAINSLVRYFGSLSGGSIGWCDGTSFYNPKKDGRCFPEVAKQGWLPWMNSDGSPKGICP